MKKRSAVRRRRIMHRRLIKFFTALAAVIIIVSGFGAIRSFAGEKESRQSAYKYYTSIQVNKGDTVESIARCRMSSEYSSVDDYIAEVSQINHLDENCHIEAGSHIIIPYYSVMRK